MLRNGELFFVPVIGSSTTAFAVDSQFVRGKVVLKDLFSVENNTPP
ncbi:MAG: hypothetical protein WA071_09565 [Undibacterium umbellatum]